jgi:hypothetical protein
MAQLETLLSGYPLQCLLLCQSSPVLLILDAKGGVVPLRSGFLGGSLGCKHDCGKIGLGSGNGPPCLGHLSLQGRNVCAVLRFNLWEQGTKKQVRGRKSLRTWAEFLPSFLDFPRPDEECCGGPRPVPRGAIAMRWQPTNTQPPPRSPLASN